jgi:dTDP-glucose pyrophosphorylase
LEVEFVKAIILAAGYATRLYPLTLNRPKALLPINNKPIINYIVEQINTLPNIDYVYVVTNDKFVKNFSDWAISLESKIPVKIINDATTNEDNRKGAIGDIQFVIEREKIDDDLIIIAGDNFFTFSLKDYYDFAIKIGKDCACAKEFDDNSMLNQFAIALIDESGKLIDLEEKPQNPKSNLVVYANYIYKKNTLPLIKKYLQEGNVPDAPGFFLQWLYKKQDVYVYKINGECFDIGTPKSYEEVQKKFSRDENNQ